MELGVSKLSPSDYNVQARLKIIHAGEDWIRPIIVIIDLEQGRAQALKSDSTEL